MELDYEIECLPDTNYLFSDALSRLPPADPVPKVDIDGEIPSFSYYLFASP